MYLLKVFVLGHAILGLLTPGVIDQFSDIHETNIESSGTLFNVVCHVATLLLYRSYRLIAVTAVLYMKLRIFFTLRLHVSPTAVYVLITNKMCY